LNDILPRYQRQIIIPEIHAEGQKRLLDAYVGIAGCGGLGAAVIPYLVAAGVGRIGVYDSDKIDLSNLNRQILFTPQDIQANKVSKAQSWIKAFSPHTQVKAHPFQILPHNIMQELQRYDLVIDCVDTISTKYHINDACMSLKKPFVHSSCVGFLGQVLVVPNAQSPCLRCLFESIPPACELENCKTAGILGATCGVIGSLAALEAIKMIACPQHVSSGRFLSFNFLDLSPKIFNFEKNRDCPACGLNPTIDPTCAADYQS
jgi:adenylyltransferase/sulfurtransferase